MTKKIFKSILVVAMAVFLACLVLIMGVLYSYYGSQQEDQLQARLSLAAKGVELSGIEYLESLNDNGSRLTWVDKDGKVLFDSQLDAKDMENHLEREEIKEALASGTGSSSRYSLTLTEQTLYSAKRLEDGTVLRISVNRYTILALTLSMMRPFIIIIGVALIMSFALASSTSKRIVKPLESIDLNKPLESDAYDELAPMLTRLEEQHRQIRRQRIELKERKSEFSAVTNSMKEGLVLLSDKGVVISINPAAKAFFGIEKDCEGDDFLSLERSANISKMIDEARQKGSSELQISREGKEYQLSASCVESDVRVSGVVILIFDITEKVFAEGRRREFTANVSHELKTPLQSIMGSAELMENGLVRPEDTGAFVGRIRSEAERLVTLIEDIIRLSQLDEKSPLPKETIDLYALASSELKAMEPAAIDRNVTLSLEGEPTQIFGVRQLLHEIVYNLCDNGIKYNVDGGSVKVTIGNDKENVILSVADTGIGIPKEDRERIFERFYRVDKSRSRQVGGTGLGLSIVKHAVEYMNGRIALESRVGEGTTITVTLPKR